MPNRVLSAVCLALLLLGLSWSLYKAHVPPGPLGEEATHVLLTESLWHDRDLTYDHRDLLRSYRIWNRGPKGLTLISMDGGRSMHFGEPFVYALASLPFYALLGVQGLLVFNMGLFLLCLAAWWFYREGAWGGGPVGPAQATGSVGDREGGAHTKEPSRADPGLLPTRGLLLAASFFASAAFAYVFRLEPAVFTMACLFLPLVLWQALRRRSAWSTRDHLLLAGAGLLLGAAFLAAGPAALLGLPILIDMALQGRWKALAAILIPALLAVSLASAAQRRATGTWSPYQAVQRSTFTDEFPVESARDLWQLRLGAQPGPWSAGPGQDASPRLLGRNAWYFLAGRHTGLLPYFPFALLALALYLAGPRDRSRHLLLGAVAAYCLLILLLHPLDWHGGPDALGNRSFALVYPALLLLPRWDAWSRTSRRALILLPFAAAGIWTLPAVAMPIPSLAHEATPQNHVRVPAFQALPLELTLLAGNSIAGWSARTWGQAIWIVPRHNFYVDEPHPNGVWVRGASSSDVLMVSPVQVDRVRLVAFSLSPENLLTLETNEEEVLVFFDSEPKRQGTRIELALSPVARDLGFFASSPQDFVYRVAVTTSDGLVPARRDPQSPDTRYLGTFLDFTGGGL
ncbi:MAG TPA: hypothetical protein VEL74_11010 [Thermoanaerobaculia bacterium]|nr:hypothetical protein [Thermoanaerobaculia bacterium]